MILSKKPGNVHGAMRVTVNGEAREFEDGLTVRGLVKALGLDAGPVAAEVNRAIVPRAEHDAVVVRDGDTVEIVHFVGGG